MSCDTDLTLTYVEANLFNTLVKVSKDSLRLVTMSLGESVMLTMLTLALGVYFSLDVHRCQNVIRKNFLDFDLYT